VVDLEWWSGGHTYTTTLRVLELDVYDLILGFDWSKSIVLCNVIGYRMCSHLWTRE
jgi:hypothetical protein